MHFFYEKYKLFLFIFYKIIKMTKGHFGKGGILHGESR